MKILQLIYALSSGGAQRFVVSLSNELYKMGHDVEICMILSNNVPQYIFNKQYLNKHIKLHSMGFDKGFSFRKVKKIEEYIKARNPDVVHCHLNVIPYIFHLAHQCRSFKFVHTLHSLAEYASGYKFQKYINKYFYSRNYILPVTISEKCRKSYIKYYGVSDVIRIDNGCELPEKTILYNEVKQEVRSYMATEYTPVFIHVARCHVSKNQELLIDAFNELDKEDVDYVLLIIGDGFDSDTGRKLKDKSCSKIHFLGEKSNVSDYLYCSNAFTLSSSYEGLPIALLEAIACGVVPICTKVGGIPDVIMDSVNGYLSDCSISSYVDAIKRYLSGDVSPLILQEYFKNNFSMECCAENYMTIFK